MSKSGIIKGTLILTAAGIIVKLIGFYNRIFLTRLIGVAELGVYQLIYPIYLLAFAICCHGTQTALTKLVSHYFGTGKFCHAKRALQIASFYCLALSILIGLLVFYNADWLAVNILKNSDCTLLIKIMAPAIPFVSFKGCLNGYFLGVQKPQYNAISLVFEQVVRLAVTILLSYTLSEQFIDATLATITLTAGEACACIVSVIIYFISEKNICFTGFKDSFQVAGKLFKDAVPLTVNKTALTLLSSLEAVMMPSMLFIYYRDNTRAMEVFGMVTGVVMPFLLFPATITNSLSTVLLPEVSYAKAKGNKNAMKKAYKGSLYFCLFMGIAAFLGFLVLGEFLGSFIFDSHESGIMLRNTAFLCPLMYVSTTMSSILNGMDMVVSNLIYHIISIIIRIVFIIFLVPYYGISAYTFGIFISYCILTACILISISRKLK